jgi:hypothetical protein
MGLVRPLQLAIVALFGFTGCSQKFWTSVCREPVEAACKNGPCPSFDVRLSQVCARASQPGQCKFYRVGHCGDLRTIESDDGLTGFGSFFAQTGKQIGAWARSDTNQFCHGMSFVQLYGLDPDCSDWTKENLCANDAGQGLCFGVPPPPPEHPKPISGSVKPTSQMVAGMALGFADVAATPAGLLVTDMNGGIRRLDDATGVSLVHATSPTTTFAVSTDGQSVAAAGYGHFFRSNDGGRSFVQQDTPDRARVFGVAFHKNDLYLFDEKGRAFVSRAGAALEPVALPKSGEFWGATFDGDTGYAVAKGGILLRSDDGGTTWKSIELPEPEPQGVLASGDHVWVSGKTGIQFSSDRGATFRSVYRLPTQPAVCTRMVRRGSAVLAACNPLDHALLWAPDGVAFQEVPTPDAADLLGVYIEPEGKLLAVGLHEVVVRGTPQQVDIVSDTEATRMWRKRVAFIRKAASTSAGKK